MEMLGLQRFVVSRKNLNWTIPPGFEELAQQFENDVTIAWGGKQKWVAAIAAMLQYLELSHEERVAAGLKVLNARARGAAHELMKEAIDESNRRSRQQMRIAAKKIPKPGGKRIPLTHHVGEEHIKGQEKNSRR
jgi:hypothetical protein